MENEEVVEEIKNEIAEWGQLHQEGCDLHSEQRYECGCSCGIKTLIENVIEKAVEFISHDLKTDNEEQRKEVIKLYLENTFNLDK